MHGYRTMIRELHALEKFVTTVKNNNCYSAHAVAYLTLKFVECSNIHDHEAQHAMIALNMQLSMYYYISYTA